MGSVHQLRRYEEPEQVWITVPDADPDIIKASRVAERNIDQLCGSRQTNAKCDHSAWRKTIESIDPHGTNGYAFKGIFLQPSNHARLSVGTLILTVDRVYAIAYWHGRGYRPVSKAVAKVLEVQSGDAQSDIDPYLKAGTFNELFVTDHAFRWAQDVLGWLATNRTDLSTFRDDPSRRR